MKIISFTMVNNEAGIIESFVRYNYNFFDEMVIVDNGCSDKTIEILKSLKDEGYNIKLFDESLRAYDQFELDNKYLDIVIKRYNPDLIVPLDADEFLCSRVNPRNILEKLNMDSIYYVNWRWYVLTGSENNSEKFIPKRITYCLEKSPWNYADGSLVTKVILPAKLYKENHLKMTMGHHDVIGSEKIKRIKLEHLKFAHYRVYGKDEFVNKLYTYVMRDIATMNNNHETAQISNQFYQLQNSKESFLKRVIDISKGGYDCNIIYSPLNLNFCDSKTCHINYTYNDKINSILGTGIEMSIREYNSERKRKEKFFLKPIIFWLDGVKEKELVLPNPSNKLTLLTSLFNVRAYLTDYEELAFLKTNYRLIINFKYLKFIPFKYIVVQNEDIKKNLIEKGVKKVVTLNEYKNKIGIIKMIYVGLLFIPSFMFRIFQYIDRNGIKNTIKKIKNRT